MNWFWKIIATFGGLTFLVGGLDVLSANCPAVDFGGSRRSMTYTCVPPGTDGAMSPGLAGTLMLLGGFALFALAWGSSIYRAYEARSIPGSNWITASPSGASSEPPNRGVPQAATSLAPVPSAYTTSHSARTRPGASNVKDSQTFTAEIDDGSNAPYIALVRYEPASSLVFVSALVVPMDMVRIALQSVAQPRLDVSGAAKKLYLGHLVVRFSENADMTAVEALLDDAGRSLRWNAIRGIWVCLAHNEERCQKCTSSIRDPRSSPRTGPGERGSKAVETNDASKVPVADTIASEPTTGTKAEGAAARADVAESLRQLKALHAEGILTDDEYETKRQRLADQL